MFSRGYSRNLSTQSTVEIPPPPEKPEENASKISPPPEPSGTSPPPLPSPLLPDWTPEQLKENDEEVLDLAIRTVNGLSQQRKEAQNFLDEGLERHTPEELDNIRRALEDINEELKGACEFLERRYEGRFKVKLRNLPGQPVMGVEEIRADPELGKLLEVSRVLG